MRAAARTLWWKGSAARATLSMTNLRPSVSVDEHRHVASNCGPGKRSYAGHGLLKAGEQLHWSAPSPDWAWDCRQRVDVEGATGAWALRTWVSGLPVAAATSAAASAHNAAMAKHLCSTKRQRSQWGEGSGRRSEYGEVRGTCPIQERVSVIHGSDTHHAYRPTEVDVSGERLLSLFTFRAPHRGSTLKARTHPELPQQPSFMIGRLWQ